MSSIFVSYAHEDRSLVDLIANRLQDHGISVWYDRMLMPGDSFVDVIRREVQQAAAVLVIITPASLASRWVAREWELAAAGSKGIVPVLAGGARISDLPATLRDRQVVMLDDFNTGMTTLAKGLQQYLASAEPVEIADPKLEKLVADSVVQALTRLGLTEENLQQMHGRDDRIASAEPIDPKLVFVMMSFKPQMDPIYEAIRQAAKAVGLRAERVKDVKGDYRITEQMLMMIRTARLLIADLSEERPNVYFELGYARGLGRQVITIAREGTEVHFDVKDWPYLPYIDSRPLEANLIERMQFELYEGTN